MDGEDRYRLRVNIKALVSALRVVDIQDHLYAERILNAEDIEQLSEQRVTTQQGVRKLVIQILPKKGTKSFGVFLKALKESEADYDFLVDKLLDTDMTGYNPEEDEVDHCVEVNMEQIQHTIHTELLVRLKKENEELKEKLAEQEAGTSRGQPHTPSKFSSLEEVMKDSGITEDYVVKCVKSFLNYVPTGGGHDQVDTGKQVSSTASQLQEGVVPPSKNESSAPAKHASRSRFKWITKAFKRFHSPKSTPAYAPAPPPTPPPRSTNSTSSRSHLAAEVTESVDINTSYSQSKVIALDDGINGYTVKSGAVVTDSVDIDTFYSQSRVIALDDESDGYTLASDESMNLVPDPTSPDHASKVPPPPPPARWVHLSNSDDTPKAQGYRPTDESRNDLMEEIRSQAAHVPLRNVERDEAPQEKVPALGELLKNVSSRRMCKLKTGMTPEATSEITISLAKDVVTYMSCIDDAPVPTAPNAYAQLMRENVHEFVRINEKQFKKLIWGLDLNTQNGFPAIVGVAESMLEQGEMNWGHVVTLYAFCGWLARYFAEMGMEQLASILGELFGVYISKKTTTWIVEHGGWDDFEEFCDENPESSDEEEWSD